MSYARWYEYLFVGVLLISSITGIIYLNSKVPKSSRKYYNFSE